MINILSFLIGLFSGFLFWAVFELGKASWGRG